MPKKKTKAPTTLRSVLQAEIRATGKTVHRISQETGINHAALYRFLDGTRQDLMLGTIEKLMAYLDLEVRRK